MRTTFVDTLMRLASENPKIWLLCGDLGYSVLEPFAAKFPDRFVNVGVAEQNMAGLAAGIALSGNTVFIYSIGNFPTLRCLEQIRNDICYHRADVKVIAVGGGYAYASQGYTHHALEDVAIMSALPGMEVFVPCDPLETRLATELIASSQRPSYLRLSRAGEPVLTAHLSEDIRVPRILKPGREILLFTSGPIASSSLAAAHKLTADGLDVGVISVTCLKPMKTGELDEIIRSARLLVTVEEHILHGGLHARISAALALQKQRPPLLGLGIAEQSERPSTAGNRDFLLEQAGLGAAGIARQIKTALADLE
jgi:transketolase